MEALEILERQRVAVVGGLREALFHDSPLEKRREDRGGLDRAAGALVGKAGLIEAVVRCEEAGVGDEDLRRRQGGGSEDGVAGVSGGGRALWVDKIQDTRVRVDERGRKQE